MKTSFIFQQKISSTADDAKRESKLLLIFALSLLSTKSLTTCFDISQPHRIHFHDLKMFTFFLVEALIKRQRANTSGSELPRLHRNRFFCLQMPVLCMFKIRNCFMQKGTWLSRVTHTATVCC